MADDPALLGILPEVAGIEAGIELKRVGVASGKRAEVGGRMDEPILLRGERCHAIGIGQSADSIALQAGPMMMKGDPVEILAKSSEGMDVAIAQARPVAKFNAKLERGLGATHEVGFVDPKPGIEEAEVRHRSFADPDGPDLIRFDKRNLDGSVAKLLGK